MVTRTARRGKTVRGKRKSTREPETSDRGVRVPAALHDAIEVERDTLSKAESLLGCLVISMEYETDSVSGPYYPDVAQIARDLVRQSINGLDSFTLKQHLLRNKVKDDVRTIHPWDACHYPVPGSHGVPLCLSPPMQ